MRKVKITTSYNVPIEYTLAGVGERTISNILDLLIIGAYFFTLQIIFYFINYNPGTLIFAFLGIPVLLYNPVCEILLEGQTFGMKLRKIKVISLNGREATVGQYLMRGVFRLVDISLSSGAIAIISVVATEKGQRLGDIAAGTTVVRVDNQESINSEKFFETEENYSIRFPEVHILSESDVAIIKEALTQSKNKRILEVLAEKVKEKLNIVTDAPAYSFLTIILKDFYHLHSGNTEMYK